MLRTDTLLKLTLKFREKVTKVIGHLFIHASFIDFWNIWQNTHRSVIFFRIFRTFFKNRRYMSQLNWCWKWKLTTILEVGGTIIKLKLEKVRVVTCEMLRKSSYRVTFYNQTTKAFLKTWKLGWLVKHRVLTRPRENFTGWELLKRCLLMIWILRVTTSNFYVFTSTLGVF